ncbi:MAG: glycerol-3-phosphate dehydrogenase/oxidase, partial [Anaerolineales bacterium]|nr:glycerol-3-phosphate dehydrogenase/oxidase [Anaerolineales bacterium]
AAGSGRGWFVGMFDFDRDNSWSALREPQRLVIIGGGITGAGIFWQAALAGLQPLLLEAHDFASGTSSRSSKLVHGGLRYLRNLQFATTWHAVRERERLLRGSGDLVRPLPFMFPLYEGQDPLWLLGLGLTLFDLFALNWQHERFDPQQVLEGCPPLRSEGLKGGYRYHDAQADDARLVLRIIQAGLRAGGHAMNYAPVERILRGPQGKVAGVTVKDMLARGQPSRDVDAAIVVNATGAWADQLRDQVDREPRLRPLRGSHLVFPRSRFPLEMAITVLHPDDQRPLFAIPWQGVTLFGTTDLDLQGPMATDLAITDRERDYLFAALEHGFPRLALDAEDALSSFAGVRSVIDSGAEDPSDESREHAIWHEQGLVTVTGGKLTTFRLMARETLRAIQARHEMDISLPSDEQTFESAPDENPAPLRLDPAGWARLQGRFGPLAEQVVECAHEGELERIQELPTRWVELRWAARAEAACHLEDLLLRRTRLGLQLPRGAHALAPRIRTIVQPELGWSDHRWEQEQEAYRQLWARYYAP